MINIRIYDVFCIANQVALKILQRNIVQFIYILQHLLVKIPASYFDAYYEVPNGTNNQKPFGWWIFKEIFLI